jgi:hypothetical protein
MLLWAACTSLPARHALPKQITYRTSHFLTLLIMATPAQSNELPHEEGLSRPVVVVDWDEMMKKKAQWVEENAEKLRERDNDPTVTSIYGFFDDKDPIQYGVPTILEVTKTLESSGIPCCLVGICALIYYGARRIRHVSITDSLLVRGIANAKLPDRIGRSACRQSNWMPQLPYSYLSPTIRPTNLLPQDTEATFGCRASSTPFRGSK